MEDFIHQNLTEGDPEHMKLGEKKRRLKRIFRKF